VKGNARLAQQPPDLLVVAARSVIQEVERARRSFERRAHGRVLRIEEAQRILLELAAVVLGKGGGLRLEVSTQRLPEGRPRLRRADGVQRDGQRAETQSVKEREEHSEHFRLA